MTRINQKNQLTGWIGAGCVAHSLRLMAFVLCAMLFAGSTAWAQSDAYSVEVAVADRSISEQSAAYSVALRRVLLNNSGDKTILNRDEIREGLQNAEQYVSSFTYRTPSLGTFISTETPITERVRSTGEATQMMAVTFDRQLVRELIDVSSGKDPSKRRVASIRSANSALVWMLIQDDQRNIMISDPEAVNVKSRSREIAGALGVTLVFPVGDEADKQAVTVDDFLQSDVDAITAASDRYEQSTTLIGNLSRNGSRAWRGVWIKITNGQRSEVSFDSPNLDDALQKGMSILASASFSDTSYRYGGDAASDTEGLVWVGSMSSLGDYASVMRFFESVPNVATVFPKEVGNNTAVFAVIPRGSLRDIESAAQAQRWLRRTQVSTNGFADDLSSNADLALEINR